MKFFPHLPPGPGLAMIPALIVLALPACREKEAPSSTPAGPDAAGRHRPSPAQKPTNPVSARAARAEAIMQRPDWAAALNELDTGDRIQAFEDLIESGRFASADLFAYAVACKNSDLCYNLMQRLGEAAAKAGDESVLKSFCTLQAGQLRRSALSSYLMALPSEAAAKRSIQILTEANLSDNDWKDAAGNCLRPVSPAGLRELALRSELPADLRDSAAFLYGASYSETLPAAATAQLASLPEAERVKAAEGYWINACIRQAERVQEAWDAGLVPQEQRMNVARSLTTAKPPQEAAAFASSIGDPEIAQATGRLAFSRWADSDRKQAGEAAMKLPAGAVRNGAVEGMADYFNSLGAEQEAAEWRARKN